MFCCHSLIHLVVIISYALLLFRVDACGTDEGIPIQEESDDELYGS